MWPHEPTLCLENTRKPFGETAPLPAGYLLHIYWCTWNVFVLEMNVPRNKFPIFFTLDFMASHVPSQRYVFFISHLWRKEGAFLFCVATMRPKSVSRSTWSIHIFADCISSPQTLLFIIKVLLTQAQNTNTPIVPPSVILTRAHLWCDAYSSNQNVKRANLRDNIYPQRL